MLKDSMTVREVITQLRHDMLVDYIMGWADEDPHVFGHQVEKLANDIINGVVQTQGENEEIALKKNQKEKK